MATYSSILAWKIPWMEEPSGLQSMESQRVGYHWEWLSHSLFPSTGTRPYISWYPPWKCRFFFSSLSFSTIKRKFSSVRSFSRVRLFCDPMICSTPGFPADHQFPEFTQTHVHHTGDAIQPPHPRSSPTSSAFNLSQHQGLFQWVCSSHQVAKVLEFQLQHQSFQWTPRTDFL